MRTKLSCLSALLLAACHAAPPAAPPGATSNGATSDGAFAEATSHRRGADSQHESLALEVARMMQSAFDTRRRVALENIANADTTAFKRRVARLTSTPIRTTDGTVVEVPTVDVVEHDFSVGAIRQTQRSLDLAIDGEGFFAVTLEDGSVGFQRGGHLHLNAAGKLVTDDGRILLPEITVADDLLDLVIDARGRVTGRTAGSPDTVTQFGELTLHRFVNPEGLLWERGVYRPTEASGTPRTGSPGDRGLGMLQQGFLEGSNVDGAQELYELELLDRRRHALAGMLGRIAAFAR